MRRDVTGANTALSFIDVLASALGAAVLLFVILASTPVSVTPRAQACGAFIRYEWRVLADQNALLRFAVASRRDASPDIIPLDNFDGVAVRKSGLPGVSSYLLTGFSRDADETLGERLLDRTHILRLNQPNPGQWRVGIFYYDRADGIVTSPLDIKVKLTLTYDSNAMLASDLMRTNVEGENRVVPAGTDTVTLKFGEQLIAPVVIQSDQRPVAKCP